MPDIVDAILGTVGIEVETELLPENLEIRGWRNTHDASCEIPVIKMGGRGFTVVRTPENIHLTRILNRGERRAIGREFVTGVLIDDEQIKISVDNIFRVLQYSGEKVENKRAGIHVHVGWAYDLETLKRTVRLAAWTESLLFHLGGMGYAFRGTDNNSAYCRPITKYGPPVVPSNIGNVQMTNIDSLLGADTICNFWNRFGGLNMYNLPRRYTPQRYMAVNLASVFFHKTLEFRMFNTTLNKEYVMSIIKLCRGLTRFTQSSVEFPDEENSVYKVTDPRVNHYILDKLCAYLDLDRTVEDPLRQILERSPVPTLNPVYVSSHLTDKFVEFNTQDLRNTDGYKQIDNFINPGIVDIHTLENEIESSLRGNRRDDNLLQMDMMHRGNNGRPRLRFEDVARRATRAIEALGQALEPDDAPPEDEWDEDEEEQDEEEQEWTEEQEQELRDHADMERHRLRQEEERERQEGRALPPFDPFRMRVTGDEEPAPHRTATDPREPRFRTTRLEWNPQDPVFTWGNTTTTTATGNTHTED